MSETPIVAVTGRSGSGKSTVAEYYRAQGYPVLDADREARAVTEPGSPVLAELRRQFGADILDDQGRLRRRLLAQRAFAAPEGTRALTRITHPAIIARLLEGVERARRASAPLCFVDGSTIIGEPFEPYCDAFVVVTAPEEDELARIQARDGISAGEARARLEAQLPQETLADRADYLIVNDGTLEQLRRQARQVLTALLRQGGA